MGLRGQVPDNEATYEDPVLGVNLHDSEEDLRAGETSLMKNLVYFGGTVSRTGSNAITASQVASSFGVKGGHKAYFNIPSQNKARLIAYDTNISTITDGGFETVIYSHQTSDLHTYFKTWSITDEVYIANGTDPLLHYDGSFVGPVGSTNIRSASYAWTASGSGTNEYYVRTAASGNPSLSDPTSTGGVWINGTFATKGSLGSLAAGEWGYGDNDTLGYSTVYVRLSDGTDPDTKSVGYVQHMSATSVPGVSGASATSQVIGLVDRLFAITENGIERTDPRDPTVWSNDSGWATFRPSQSGTFKAMIPHSVTGQDGEPINGALAITENSYYFFTGTDFGSDVTNGTASTGEDSSIIHIDDVGCFGPRSVTSVPGVGTFWLTNNKDVFYVPAGHSRGNIVGTRIVNTGNTSTKGLESLRVSLAASAWMIYHEPYLMLGFPIDSDNHPTYQYWMDMNRFRVNKQIPIWYGPMIGQTVLSVWQENQQGDNALVAGEGNATTGVFVYNLRVPSVYSDKVGTSTNNLSMQMDTYLKSGGAPSREKYLEQLEIEMNNISGSATCDISDLSGTILTDVKIEKTFV